MIDYDDILNPLSNCDYISESTELSSGIFWVLTDDMDISEYKFLYFDIPCDKYGVPSGDNSIELNSKNGLTYNHEKIWNTVIKNDSNYRNYNNKSFDYYPRGRVQISNNKAIIYLNPNINTPEIIDEIKRSFGLYPRNISKVRVNVDNSSHYKCWMDEGDILNLYISD